VGGCTLHIVAQCLFLFPFPCLLEEVEVVVAATAAEQQLPQLEAQSALNEEVAAEQKPLRLVYLAT
jgi:hypothetical protein